MFGFQQCCDADIYADLGKLCSNSWNSCWHEYRPIGAIFLNTLIPNGLAPFNHILLLLFSLLLIAHESGLKFGRRQSKPEISIILFKALGAFLILEVMFIGLASVNLTDVAAGVFAALAIWGFSRKNTLLFSLAGGLSVLIRAAYLYPLIVLVVFILAESMYKKNREGYFVALFFVCIAPQYWLTWQHTGTFSFLDPSSVKYWKDFHFVRRIQLASATGGLIPKST